jgi:hypothetical protein
MLLDADALPPILTIEASVFEVVEQLRAQGYHFPTLLTPFRREELHSVVFGVKVSTQRASENINQPICGNC